LLSQEPTGSRVTIRDVAALAGVSVGTASKALNNRGQLREQTRARVLAAAHELNFRPNPLARSLSSGRTYTVGLVTTDSFGRFSIPVMLGVEDALGAEQMSVFLCDTRDDPIREQHHVRTLLGRQVDGIIVTGRRIEPRPPLETDRSVAIVYAMTQSADPSDLSVIPDDEGGGALAARHLLASGRQRIGHITGPDRFLATHLRAMGMAGVLDEAGLPVAGGEVLFGEWSEDWGRQGADILLRAQPDLDAVFCGSDQIARGVTETLRERGRRVPEDVAIVGFDNWEPMATGCRPALTTVDPNLHEVGRVAAEHLLAAINGEPTEPGVRKVPGWLVVRASTGAASP
jgi:LacI family transcriptional regulator